jgi:hypothetical protein
MFTCIRRLTSRLWYSAAIRETQCFSQYLLQFGRKLRL